VHIVKVVLIVHYLILLPILSAGFPKNRNESPPSIEALEHQHQQPKMIRNIGVAGVVAFLLIAALTLNQLVPSEFERGERASRKLTSPRDGGLDFRNLNKCALIHLGKVHGDDKFVSHTFGDLYCETMAPFRSSRAPLRMLEIGFGCGHHNHGKSALGKITRTQVSLFSVTH
jgi:hypothetical protein